MLPEREQRVLRQIEEHLRAEDPQFASSFSAGFSAARRKSDRWWRFVMVLLDVTVALMTVVGVVAGQGWLIFAGLVCAGPAVYAHRVQARARKSGA
jgi:hypothetical protein